MLLTYNYVALFIMKALFLKLMRTKICVGILPCCGLMSFQTCITEKNARPRHYPGKGKGRNVKGILGQHT